MFGNIQIRDLKVNINAAWITILSNKDVIFKRHGSDHNWYDPQHTEIVKALMDLEKAVLKACAEKNSPPPSI